MKKILPYILILTVILQIFAPFTIGLGEKNNLEIQPNKVKAEETGIILKTTNSSNSESIKIDVEVIWSIQMWGGLREGVMVTLLDSSGIEVASEEVDLEDVPNLEKTQKGEIVFSNLTPDTNYIVRSTARQVINLQYGDWPNLITWNFSSLWNLTPEEVTTFIQESSLSQTILENGIKTQPSENQDFISQEQQTSYTDAALLPSCELLSASTWGGCIGIILYKLIFKPSAYIFAITGKLLDYTFFYTIQDTSYRSQFVVQGWEMVRDFCNMFFIFILLYIAFGTILNLHGVKPKEMIINVVIIGLLINFSLFTTQVIIDASNILARVFYNQILIGEKDKDTSEIKEELGFGGSKQLTVALVNKINPQKILLSAEKGSNITGKGIIKSETDKGANGIDSGTFILVVILASIMNIIGLYVFFMVSLVFIARVVGLWLAMIVVPMTFFSYAVPQMQDMEMIGWKRWWPETFKMAFLAPVFIMFLYLIIMFLNSGMGVLDANDKEGIDFFIAIIVPFAFLMILLLRAKDLTTKMSGKIGESLTGIAKSVGGFAVGAGLGLATGGAAMAMRGTLGAFGSKIAGSEKLANMEAKGGAKGWMAGRLRDIGTGTSKASFDVRATKLGALAGKTGGFDMGKAKAGGFDKYKDEKDKKRKDRAEKIKTITTKAEQKNVTAAQIDLKESMLSRKPELDSIDKDIAEVRQKMNDANNGKDKVKARAALVELEALQAQRKIIRDTTKDVTYDKTTKLAVLGPNDTLDSNGNVIKSITDAEKAERDALHHVSVQENKVLNDYAKSLTTGVSKTINLITSLGQDRASGIEKTALDIRAGKKVEKDKGDVGH